MADDTVKITGENITGAKGESKSLDDSKAKAKAIKDESRDSKENSETSALKELISEVKAQREEEKTQAELIKFQNDITQGLKITYYFN